MRYLDLMKSVIAAKRAFLDTLIQRGIPPVTAREITRRMIDDETELADFIGLSGAAAVSHAATDEELPHGWRQMGDFYEYSTTRPPRGRLKPSAVKERLDDAGIRTSIGRRGMDVVVAVPVHQWHAALPVIAEMEAG
jgi:hypothetical protein